VSWFFRLRVYSLLAAAIVLFLAHRVSDFSSSHDELKRGADVLASKFQYIQTDLKKRISEQLILPGDSQKKISRQLFQTIESWPYIILIYRNDSLMFWNRNDVIPHQPPSSFSDSIKLLHLKNGYYLTFSEARQSKSGKTINLVALALLKHEYQTSNAYLRNQFGQLFDFPSYFMVDVQPQPGFIPVKSPSGATILYLGIDEQARKTKPGLISPILFVTALVLLLVFAQRLIALAGSYNSWFRPVGWAIAFTAIAFLLNNQMWLPADVVNWNMFNPVLFASGGIATSLGGLFLELLVLLWIGLDLTNNFRPHIKTNQSSIGSYLVHLFGYLVIFLLVIYSVTVIKALVLDSRIEFAFINPLQPDYYSLLGVLCVALVLLCLFLFCEKIIYLLHRYNLSFWDRLLLLLICTTGAITYYFIFSIGISGLWVMLWIIILILLLTQFRLTMVQSFAFSRLFLWLVFFAASGALLLFYYGGQKEHVTRLAYARKLITDRDAVTEFLLEELKPKIESDDFLIHYFEAPQLASKQIAERLQQLYFLEGFERYSIRFLPFDVSGMLLPGWGEEFGFVTENGVKSDKSPTGVNDVTYAISPSGNITYLARYRILRNDTLLGNLYAELKADVYKSAGVYPELLLPEEERLPNSSADYSYAIYNRGQLIDHSGSIYYDYRLPWPLQHNVESQFISDKTGDHLIYSPIPNVVIVISKERNSLSYFLSFFSFLFSVMFALVLGMLIIGATRRFPPFPSFSSFFREAPLRSLIHAFFLLFILAMLITIGYVTGQYFLKQFNELAKSTVHEKMDRVSESFSLLLQQGKSKSPGDFSIRDAVRSNMAQVAAIQANEINVYDRSGSLMASSQPSIFEKGIISRKINPLAYYELRREAKTEMITEEKIGELSFYSGYAALRDDSGQPLLYINLPYYNSRKILNDQVGFFFIALVNILVITIIITGFMAPFISKQITLRLSLIAGKLRKVNLGAANEKIDWPARDEIGSLVNEYNRMLDQLEASANSLARTQRQLAWREMARQVAHEIKNPLTPMKLSIQHLQRAYVNHDPNVNELTVKVTRTLIEQIDALSEFATEFSNYANMPKAQLENINVNEVLQSACELHSKNETALIRLHGHAERGQVEADKHQLISVFNNLLLNAIQSIPPDRPGMINVATENVDGQIVISVSDNGVGISEEEASRVFLPNFTTKSSGTGLGLAISKNIVESFNGSISFNSKKDVGTTFFVTLPLV
jgi:signal transduction histidine kinase